MSNKVDIDLNKLKRDIVKQFKGKTVEAMALVDNKDKVNIGNDIIREMKNLIKKGVSPIAEFGRFPAYKWAGRANQALKVSRSLTGAKKKRARAKAKSIKSNKYPYSVQHKFPWKRERPVNLELSGDFLYDLEARPLRNGVSIGFATKKAELKEQGHREGVNGQPPRPIIPQKKENFSPSIYRRLVDSLSLVLRRKIRT